MLSPSRIVCAACMDELGNVVLGARHFDMRMCKIIENGEYGTEWIQGFIDQHGSFFDRQDAWIIAERNGQIIRKLDHILNGTLYSENLY